MPVALLGLVLLVGFLDGLVGGVATGAASGAVDGVDGGGAGAGGSVLGVVAACTSAVGYAAVTLLGRSLSARVDPAHATTLGFAVAAVAALPAGAAAGMAFAPGLPSLALVVYLGVVPTALAYGLFFTGLRRTASGTASVPTLVEPLTATLLAVLLLGERLAPVQAGGAVLLVVAVLVLSVPWPRPAPTLGR